MCARHWEMHFTLTSFVNSCRSVNSPSLNLLICKMCVTQPTSKCCWLYRKQCMTVIRTVPRNGNSNSSASVCDLSTSFESHDCLEHCLLLPWSPLGKWGHWRDSLVFRICSCAWHEAAGWQVWVTAGIHQPFRRETWGQLNCVGCPVAAEENIIPAVSKSSHQWVLEPQTWPREFAGLPRTEWKQEICQPWPHP